MGSCFRIGCILIIILFFVFVVLMMAGHPAANQVYLAWMNFWAGVDQQIAAMMAAGGAK